MKSCFRVGHRILVTLASLGLTAGTASAQLTDLRGLPPEVLNFSFVAPPQPRAMLKAWDGVVLPDQGFNLVLGPVEIDWNRTNLDWRFAWESNTPSVTSVRWEISKYPFPASGDFAPAPGFGLVGSSSDHLFFVDLNLLAPRPPNWSPTLAFQGITGAFKSTGIVLPPTDITSATRLTRLGALNVRFAGALIPDTSSASVQAYAAQADPVIAQSMSLYGRVVPLSSLGLPIGPPSNVVVLNFFEPDPTNVLPPPVFVHATAALAGYTPVRPYNFNWSCHVVQTRDAYIGTTLVLKGTKGDICDSDSDIVGDVVDAFGDVFEFVADFVNWVSDTYGDIKAEVASQMSATLTKFNIPCNQTCASIALNTAMAAAGMPPEIPDVEQLKAMGEGYLVDAVADYAEAQTGVPVPPAVREEIRQQAAKMIDDAAGNVFAGGEGSSLFVPDVTYQFHGPIVVVDLTNTHNQYVSMTEPLRIEDQTGRYKVESFFIPPIRPGQTLRIALTLDPIQDPKAWMNLLPSGEDSPLFGTYWQKMDNAEAALEEWRALYRTDDLTLKVKVGPYDAFTAILPAK
jgi:hypothetical protein